MALVMLGACLVVWGVVGGIAFSQVAGINEIVIGVLLVALAEVCLPLQVNVNKARFFNRNGSELASISKVSEKKGNLLAKTIVLGSMPETVFIRPEELCGLLSILEFDIVKKLPEILYASWKSQRHAEKGGKR